MVILAMRSALAYFTSPKGSAPTRSATSFHGSAGRIFSEVSVVGFAAG